MHRYFLLPDNAGIFSWTLPWNQRVYAFLVYCGFVGRKICKFDGAPLMAPNLLDKSSFPQIAFPANCPSLSCRKLDCLVDSSFVIRRLANPTEAIWTTSSHPLSNWLNVLESKSLLYRKCCDSKGDMKRASSHNSAQICRVHLSMLFKIITRIWGKLLRFGGASI